jgi:hypothetical protein
MITTPLLLVLAALAGVSDVSAKPVKRTGNVPGSIELSATRANRTLVDQRLKTAVKYAYFLPEDMRKRMDKWERDHEEWEIQRRAAAPCAHGPISVALKDVNNDLEYLAPVVIG